MADGFMVVDQEGDNYGPFSTETEAEDFKQFLCCGDEMVLCDVVAVTIPTEEWNRELFD